MNLNVALTILVGTCFVLFGSIRRDAVWLAPSRRVLGPWRQTVTVLDSTVFTYIGAVLLLWSALRVAVAGY